MASLTQRMIAVHLLEQNAALREQLAAARATVAQQAALIATARAEAEAEAATGRAIDMVTALVATVRRPRASDSTRDADGTARAAEVLASLQHSPEGLAPFPHALEGLEPSDPPARAAKWTAAALEQAPTPHATRVLVEGKPPLGGRSRQCSHGSSKDTCKAKANSPKGLAPSPHSPEGLAPPVPRARPAKRALEQAPTPPAKRLVKPPLGRRRQCPHGSSKDKCKACHR